MPNKFDEEILPQLQQNPQKAVSVQGTGSFVGAENAVVETPRTYDFFAVKNESNANTLKVTIQKKPFHLQQPLKMKWLSPMP